MDMEPNEDRFNPFLSWLSSDREEAGRKYEDMRRRLIFMLECRGCNRAEEIADVALDRFMKRLPEIRDTYQGDPVSYLCVIARNVHLEYTRKPEQPLPDNIDKIPDDEDNPDEFEELMHECLERCLKEFDLTNRKLLLAYYEEEKQAKINFRKSLAKNMGIAGNALRLRVHRLRRALELCMNNCLGVREPAK
jgi:DNA-directed RNA polymerase specialized sigma24 family protein